MDNLGTKCEVPSCIHSKDRQAVSQIKGGHMTMPTPFDPKMLDFLAITSDLSKFCASNLVA